MDIRIVQLSPGGFGDEIECDLRVCNVDFEYPIDPAIQIDGSKSLRFSTPTFHAVSSSTDEPIWYTALSYVWGNPSLVKSIKCNGKIFQTTGNLYTALQHLRQPDATVNLWIDQICINQNDIKEKAQQIVLMSKIYQRAWSTIVWLGEEADDSDNACDLIILVKDSLQYFSNLSDSRTVDLESLDLPEADASVWKSLGKLLARPWFQRLWIIQEAVLSHNLNFLCGRRFLSWPDLGLFATCATDNRLETLVDLGRVTTQEIAESGITRIRMIDRMINYEWTHPRQSSLLGALVDGRGSQATDPRDKIYGIMGMTAAPLHPDYALSTAEVYTNASLRVLDAGYWNLIDLLCCVHHDQPAIQLPSWVPDWSQSRQTVSLGYQGRGQGIYHAAKFTTTSWNHDPNTRILRVSGLCCDTIADVGSVAESSLADTTITQSPTQTFILDCIRRLHAYDQRTLGFLDTFETFWNTLVAGKDHTGTQKAPADYGPIFALLTDTATGRSPTFPDQPILNRKLALSNLEVRRPSRVYREMQTAYKAAVQGRRFGITMEGQMGLYPQGTSVGDRVCIFKGGHVPFVLRPDHSHHSHRLVGECYQRSIMDGQMAERVDLESEEIELT